MKNILVVFMFVGACLFIPESAVSDQVTHSLRCASEEFSPHRCQYPVAPRNSEIREVRMKKQLSSKACLEGKSWVADASGITVKNGCKADFIVIYQTFDRLEEDPTDIVIRSFEDIFNKRPSREKITKYRSLIIDRGWTERQIRDDMRNRKRSGDR